MESRLSTTGSNLLSEEFLPAPVFVLYYKEVYFSKPSPLALPCLVTSLLWLVLIRNVPNLTHGTGRLGDGIAFWPQREKCWKTKFHVQTTKLRMDLVTPEMRVRSLVTDSSFYTCIDRPIIYARCVSSWNISILLCVFDANICLCHSFCCFQLYSKCILNKNVFFLFPPHSLCLV